MKKLLATGAILLAFTGTAVAADPTPKDVEAHCTKTTTVSTPLPDPVKAFTVYSKLSMFCKISLVDAKYHPETKLFYMIPQFTLVNRKSDDVPFTPRGRTYSSPGWKPMKKVGSNLFIASYELERKAAIARKFWEWQAQATVSYQIQAVDHQNGRPIWDVQTTDLKVSAISELKFK